MNKTLFLFAAAFLILATGCNDQRFKKEKDGSEYKIISKGGKAAVAGDFMQINMLAKYKDSVLFSTEESSMPRFIPFDTTQLPDFFKSVHEGDSLVLRQSTDSIMKMGQSAPFMEKGQYIYQTFKVVKLWPSKEAADSVAKTFEVVAKTKAYQKSIELIEKNIAEDADLVKEDDKTITDFLAKENLQATKTKWGTYVLITNPGTGENLNQNNVAVVNYTGKTFQDSTFDSNTDKKFNHVEPLYVDLGEFRGIIPGLIDGLKMMQKGSKGKIVIPSYLAYGKNGAPPKIGPNENLVFDVEVTDILSSEQYAQQMEMQQRLMQMQMQQMQEQQQHQQAPANR